MNFQNIFERYELKYVITQGQKARIIQAMESHMTEDSYGRSTICNIYFDLPNYLLIRRSHAKPVYKEKLRVRSYGIVTSSDPVFIELKKKYKSIVYKRRIDMPEQDAMSYLLQGVSAAPPCQIHREIDYFRDFYGEIRPSVFLSYDREAFFAKEDGNFRITFDEHMLWRDSDLSLTKGIYGTALLDAGHCLMEVKTAGAIPLWLVSILTEEEIYKTSFSKYGAAFQQILQNTLAKKGPISYA